jgi:hypothetical protein
MRLGDAAEVEAEAEVGEEESSRVTVADSREKVRPACIVSVIQFSTCVQTFLHCLQPPPAVFVRSNINGKIELKEVDIRNSLSLAAAHHNGIGTFDYSRY